MTDSPLRAKGRAMRRNLMGAAYADKLDQQLYHQFRPTEFVPGVMSRIW